MLPRHHRVVGQSRDDLRRRGAHRRAVLHAAHRRRRGQKRRRHPETAAVRRRQGVDQHGGGEGPGFRRRSRRQVRQPVHRRRHRRQEGFRRRRGRPLGDLYPWRPREDRHRRGRVCAKSRRPRRRRNPADLDGPRRHQGRLRHRADPRGRRRGARAGHRVAAASARSIIWSKAYATAMPRRCSPPRSSTSAPIRSPRPRRIWRRPACRCGWTLSPRRNKRPS